MKKGIKVLLPELKVGDAGIHPNGFKFIVEERVAEDRVSGHTIIRYEDGIHTDKFLWDDWPTAKFTYLGKGKIKSTLILDGD